MLRKMDIINLSEAELEMLLEMARKDRIHANKFKF